MGEATHLYKKNGGAGSYVGSMIWGRGAVDEPMVIPGAVSVSRGSPVALMGRKRSSAPARVGFRSGRGRGRGRGRRRGQIWVVFYGCLGIYTVIGLSITIGCSFFFSECMRVWGRRKYQPCFCCPHCCHAAAHSHGHHRRCQCGVTAPGGVHREQVCVVEWVGLVTA